MGLSGFTYTSLTWNDSSRWVSQRPLIHWIVDSSLSCDTPGCELDVMARERMETVYIPDGVRMMLPSSIGATVCVWMWMCGCVGVCVCGEREGLRE
jgi:hypothetical protein